MPRVERPSESKSFSADLVKKVIFDELFFFGLCSGLFLWRFFHDAFAAISFRDQISVKMFCTKIVTVNVVKIDLMEC